MSPLELALPSRSTSPEPVRFATTPISVSASPLPLTEPKPLPEAGPGLFTEEEAAALRGDDAMAGGMISVILSIAFCVLMSLVIGVTYWTMTAAG